MLFAVKSRHDGYHTYPFGMPRPASCSQNGQITHTSYGMELIQYLELFAL